MSKFIALRKTSRSEAENLATLSSSEKRQEMVKGESDPEKSHALDDLGLSKVEPDEQAPDAHNSYQQLDYMGAYVVDTDDKRIERQAIKELTPEYYIMPNIALSLPRPKLSRTYRRRPSRPQYWPEESGVQLAHQSGVLGQGVLVGVLDTGCDADHIELRDKEIDFRYVPFNPVSDAMRACRGFDVDGHGTHVCGIISGKNVGIAPEVELMAASVIESETLHTSLERIVVALNWMLSHFKQQENLEKPTILNLSLGFRTDLMGNDEQAFAVLNGMELILNTLVEDFDVLPVVSIGNDGPGIMRVPGYFPSTLSVGAVDYRHQPAPFSGGGISPITQKFEPNLVGYGVDVLSSLERYIDGRSLYADISGTSMATPYVAGIAALHASAHPELQGAKLRQYLMEEVLPLDFPADRVGVGLARFTEVEKSTSNKQ